MTGQAKFFCSTIGRKQLIAVTGLALSLFVLTHMLGNLLLFVGPKAYNEYSHQLTSNKLIFLAEAGLLGAFLIHMVLAVRISIYNRLCRPQAYYMSASGDKATSPATKSLWAQGIVILVFSIYHLFTFKFGNYYEADYGSGPIRDLHRLVVEVFESPSYVLGYALSLLILGVHLSHGIKSSLQTLGFHHPRYECKVKLLSRFYGALVALGFLSQPLYVFFIYRG